MSILVNDDMQENDTLIFDNIHSYIEVDPIARQIIDTEEFQRLRRIHQGGVLYYVFPTANHSRFEHSIGTYHLAKKFINNLRDKQPELNITDNIVKIVSVAGLCHDLGHLMYSHLIDDLFLPMLPNYKDLGDLAVHEIRSIVILKKLIKKNNIPISDEELKVIGDLINPKTSNYEKWSKEFQVGKWIFEIISNPRNNVDVDKFDYINRDNRAIGLKLDVDFSRLIMQARVINDEICYPIQAKENLYHLFFIRYQLHRRIYSHKTVKSIEILFCKLLFELEKTDRISEKIKDVDGMIELVDSFIYNSKNKVVKQIINQVETRKLPSLVFEHISLNKFKLSEEVFSKFPKDSYQVMYYKVGYTSGKNPNPLSKISFYRPKNNEIIPDITIQNFSLLTNDNHQEFVCRVYCNDKSIKDELYHCLN
jgi:HD superfamily phosphohydrolase